MKASGWRWPLAVAAVLLISAASFPWIIAVFLSRSPEISPAFDCAASCSELLKTQTSPSKHALEIAHFPKDELVPQEQYFVSLFGGPCPSPPSACAECASSSALQLVQNGLCVRALRGCQDYTAYCLNAFPLKKNFNGSGTVLRFTDAPSLGHLGTQLCSTLSVLLDRTIPAVRALYFTHESCTAAGGRKYENIWKNVIRPLFEMLADEAGRLRGASPEIFDASQSGPEDSAEIDMQPPAGTCSSFKTAHRLRELAYKRFGVMKERVVGIHNRVSVTFVSRTHSRVITNGEEIVQAIQSTYGDQVSVRTVNFGGSDELAMSLEQQIQVLADTDIFIAAHGAAESLIFALPTNAVVLEILPPGLWFPLFSPLAHAARLHHLFYLAPGDQNDVSNRCSRANLISRKIMNPDMALDCRGANFHVDLAGFLATFWDATQRVVMSAHLYYRD